MKYDVTLNDDISYFDPELSYEITGYRPITMNRGLDFDPTWFNEAARNKTGPLKKYTHYPKGSKKWVDFWRVERERCMYGMGRS